jgi:hypothetical protein
MVRPVCARYTALITTLPSSSIRTDTGSRRITVQPKPEVSPNQNDRLPLAPIEPTTGGRRACDHHLILTVGRDDLTARNTASKTT